MIFNRSRSWWAVQIITLAAISAPILILKEIVWHD